MGKQVYHKAKQKQTISIRPALSSKEREKIQRKIYACVIRCTTNRIKRPVWIREKEIKKIFRRVFKAIKMRRKRSCNT